MRNLSLKLMKPNTIHQHQPVDLYLAGTHAYLPGLHAHLSFANNDQENIYNPVTLQLAENNLASFNTQNWLHLAKNHQTFDNQTDDLKLTMNLSNLFNTGDLVDYQISPIHLKMSCFLKICGFPTII